MRARFTKWAPQPPGAFFSSRACGGHLGSKLQGVLQGSIGYGAKKRRRRKAAAGDMPAQANATEGLTTFFARQATRQTRQVAACSGETYNTYRSLTYSVFGTAAWIIERARSGWSSSGGRYNVPTHGNVPHMVMPLTGDCITRSWSRTTVVSMARQTFTHRRLSLFQGVLALRAWRVGAQAFDVIWMADQRENLGTDPDITGLHRDFSSQVWRERPALLRGGS